MQTTEQRLSALNQRIREISQKKQRRRKNIIISSFAAACLLLITGLSFGMPGVMAKLSDDSYNQPGLTAGIFDSGSGLGYLLISLLAFTLGVCLTILSYRINNRNSEKRTEKEE